MEPDNQLIDKLLREPLKFDDNDVEAFISCYQNEDGKLATDLAFTELRACLRRVYDLNENRLLEASSANEGMMGFFNKISTNHRRRRYFKRIRNRKANKNYIIIYSEGDSWLQFPVFVRDITDWLLKKKEYLIYSDAYAGDWMANIIYEGQYIEGLSTHDPDVFLLSGGGNDFLGVHRLATMVNTRKCQTKKYTKPEDLAAFNLTSDLQEKILSSQEFITKEFYSFLRIIEIQYTILFKQLYSADSKFQNLISITQGYAYPYPHKGVRFSLRYPLRPLVNWVTGTGRWLYEPLMLRGIFDKDLQHAIVATMLFEFNNTMMRITGKFENVYFIDNRDVPKGKSDWFDEIHLKSHLFKVVAEKYDVLIKEKTSKKR